MTSEFRSEEVVFRHPFTLPGYSGTQPAGTYVVETEDALIEGLSFAAWQRVSTTITRRASRPGETIQALALSQLDLAEALRAEALRAEAGRAGRMQTCGMQIDGTQTGGIRTGGIRTGGMPDDPIAPEAQRAEPNP